MFIYYLKQIILINKTKKYLNQYVESMKNILKE